MLSELLKFVISYW